MNDNINESNKFNNFLLSVIPKDQYNFSKAVFALGRKQYFTDKRPDPAKQQLYTKMYNNSTSSLSRMSIKQLINNKSALTKQSYQAHRYMIHHNIAKDLNKKMDMYDDKVNNATSNPNPRVWDAQKINNYSRTKIYRYRRMINGLYKKFNVWNNLAKKTSIDLKNGISLNKNASEIESGSFAKKLYYKQKHDHSIKLSYNNKPYFTYNRSNYKQNYYPNNTYNKNRNYNYYRENNYSYNRNPYYNKKYNYSSRYDNKNNYYRNYKSNFYNKRPFSSRIRSQRNYVSPVKPHYNYQPHYSREQIMQYRRSRGIQR